MNDLKKRPNWLTHTALSKIFCTILTSSAVHTIAASAATPPAKSSASTSAQQSAAKTTGNNSECLTLLKAAQAADLASGSGDAEEKYKAALDSAEKSHDNQSILDCGTALANCLQQEAGKLPEEETLRQKNLELAAKTFGETSPQYASALAQTATLNARKGEIEKAQENTEKAMLLLNNAEDKHPLEMSDCYQAIALRQIAQGTFGLADDSFKKALELRQSKLPDSAPPVVYICRQYSDLLKQLDRKDEASKLTQRIALARATSASSAFRGSGKAEGKGSLFSKLMDEAKTAEKAGDHEAAINNTKLAIAEAEKSPGKDGRLPYALVHLGDYYSVKNQTDEAKAVYARALDLRQQTGANANLGMVRNLERLSAVALRDKNPGESQRLLGQALEIEDKVSAPDSMIANTLQTLLSDCIMSKDYGKAEQYAKRLSQAADKLPEPIAGMKKRMATAMLGSVYMQSGRQSEGLALLKSISTAPTQSGPEIGKIYMDDYSANEKLFDDSEQATFAH